MRQICQLKYFMRFSLFEISTMTAEEREFYLNWFAEIKAKENEAANKATQTTSAETPTLGPAAG